MGTSTVSTPPTIQYLRLDADYDPLFDPSANLTDLDAVAQAIETRLKLFLGEWWENLNLGYPVFQAILGQLASPSGLTAMQQITQQNIQGGPYVVGTASVTVSYTGGTLSLSYTATTSFGVVSSTLTPFPALSASLGG
jgi:hypothetical protein